MAAQERNQLLPHVSIFSGVKRQSAAGFDSAAVKSLIEPPFTRDWLRPTSDFDSVTDMNDSAGETQKITGCSGSS